MSLTSFAGLTSGFNSLIPRWVLVKTEPAFAMDSIEGQYPAQDISSDDEAIWSEVEAPTRTLPISQWIRTGQGSFSFVGTFHNETILDSFASRIERLRSWRQPDPQLGRPPIVRFHSGDTEFTGFLASINVRYPTLPWMDGRQKTAVVSITLREADSANVAAGVPGLVDPGKPEPRSRYRIVAEGQTFEALALLEYGKPEYGVLLRQESLDAFPRVGDRVFLPDASVYRRRLFAPDSYLLGDALDALKARQDVLDALGGATKNPVG